MEQMSNLTDPAREFAELCVLLSTPSEKAGDAFLANKFQVEPWSKEFFQILFAILERAEQLNDLVGQIDLDDDFKNDARQHIRQITRAFEKSSLQNAWHTASYGASLLSGANVQPIKMISPMVRARISYPRLNDKDVAELQAAVQELQKWLDEHQLSDRDFIRQMILEGTNQLQFRLARLSWFGWGYTVAALKDIIAAYMALDQTSEGAAVTPDAEAVLKKTRRLLTQVFEKAGVAKEVFERGDWVLRAMGAVSLVQHGTTVSGLLTYMHGG